MSVKGRLKADQLVAYRVSIDWTKAPPAVNAVAALVDSNSGKTHGFVDGHTATWSKNTRELLSALRQSLEEDIAAAHFDNHMGTTSSDTTRGINFPEPGLGEHLEGRDPPIPSV